MAKAPFERNRRTSPTSPKTFAAVIAPTPVTSLMVVAVEPTTSDDLLLELGDLVVQDLKATKAGEGQLGPHSGLALQDPSGAQQLGLRDEAWDLATVPRQQDREVGM